MTSTKPKQRSLVIKINPNVYRELTIIAEGTGFENLEMLVSNYLREVALAARMEVATHKTRRDIVKGSTDLDHLNPVPVKKR